MKKINFNVEVEFEDHINSNNEIFELMVNIKDALVHEINTKGIVPENSETFTKNVKVSNSVIESEIEEKLF
jgi:hypothetical protein